MPGSPSSISPSDPRPAGIWVSAALIILMMLGYITSFAIFVTRSEDFIPIERQARSARLHLPVVLDLTTTSAQPTALFEGWSYPEPWGTWTIGDQASVRFLIPELNPGLRLRARIHLDRCFAPSAENPVSIEVFLDRIRLINRTFISSDAVVLEADHLRTRSGDRLDLVLRITGASSPISRDLGSDHRILGFGVSKIELLQIP
ncbi:MAG: hypothetical protein R3F07_17250 [Opitutaceae bacterium]